MQSWWKPILKEYFTFSKKERVGLLSLTIITLIIYLVSHFWPVSQSEGSPAEFQQQLANLKISIDSSRNKNFYSKSFDDEPHDYDRSEKFDNWKNSKAELFVFDPNTVDEAGWQKLGIRNKTIHIIQNYLAKGYRFKHPEDISKIYGLSKDDADRLIPYIQINPTNTNTETSTAIKYSSGTPTNKVYKPIEINTADTTAFIALPGIGSKLANRIIQYRDKLGGFYSIQQLAETYGLQDSSFQKIKPRLICNAEEVKQINLNTADVNELKNHPYIRWNIANAIISYRSQHGRFVALEDLMKIDLINEEIYKKLKPYIRI